MKKRIIIVMTVLAMLLGMSDISAFAASTDVVNIPDAALKANINTKLGVADKSADITQGQLESLTSLSLAPLNGNVASLEGLQYATNLQALTTGGLYTETSFTDLTPLMGLTNFTRLQIYGPSKITDFTQISQMTKLTSLHVSNAPNLTSIEGVSNLTNLNSLGVSGVSNIDLSEISNMSQLTSLTVNGTEEGALDLDKTGVSFDNFTNLKELTMRYTSLKNLNVLPANGNITNLTITDGVLADLSGINKMPNLRTVTLTDNKITTYDPLIPLTKLEVINGSDNLLTDMEFLKSMPNVEDVFLYKNNIKNFPDLSGATSLAYLYVSENQIEDISNIGTLTNTLESINLDKNLITDFRPAAALTTGYPNLFQARILNQSYYLGTFEKNEPIENIVYYDYDGSEMPLVSRNTLTSSTQTYGEFEYQDGTLKWLEVGDNTYNKLIATNIDFNNVQPSIIYTSINVSADVTPASYTLSFDLNGGEGETPASQQIEEGTYGSAVSNPTREGFEFDGWNTMADGSGTPWDFATTLMPGADTTLYAQWIKADTPSPEEGNETPKPEETTKTGDEENLLAMWALVGITGTTIVIARKKKNIK